MKYRMMALALCAFASTAVSAFAEAVTEEETIAHLYRAEDRWAIMCGTGTRYVCATVEGSDENPVGSFEVQEIGIKPGSTGNDYEEFPSTESRTVCLQRPVHPGAMRADVRITGWTNPSGQKLDYAITATCFRFSVFPYVIETRTNMYLNRDDP